MNALVEVRDLVKLFPIRGTRDVVSAVNGVSFQIGSGETLGLVGESGSGKTTVGRCILRLIEPTAGQIWFEGDDITYKDPNSLRALRPKMQLVFQDPTDSLDPRRTAMRLLLEPIKDWCNLSEKEARDWALEIARRVGLDTMELNKYPNELSGGQQQRVGIARAISTNPKFLVLDEPTSMLDPSAGAEIIDLLIELQEEMGLAYLFISHDLTTVKYVSNRVAVMYLGKVVELADVAELFELPMHPYSKALLSSVLIPDPFVERRLITMEGEIPSPIDLPNGCYLFSRCPEAGADCLKSFPDLLPIVERHQVACFRVLPRDHLHTASSAGG